MVIKPTNQNLSNLFTLKDTKMYSQIKVISIEPPQFESLTGLIADNFFNNERFFTGQLFKYGEEPNENILLVRSNKRWYVFEEGNETSFKSNSESLAYIIQVLFKLLCNGSNS